MEVINFLKFVDAVKSMRLFQNIVWTNYVKNVLTAKHGWQSYHEICGHTVFNNTTRLGGRKQNVKLKNIN